MSDDEEVVLKDCELHKYMKINYIYNENANIVDKTVDCDHHKIIRNTSDTDQLDCNNVLNSFKKINVDECTGHIIYIIMKTGLLYPDHIVDLEYILEMENIKENNSKTNIMICFSSLVATSSIFVMLNKNFKILQCLSLSASVYFGYKINSVIKTKCILNKIHKFMNASEQLFLITKKCLLFIVENEFLLRNKVLRNQPFYIPSSGWVEPNTNEGLKCSGLIVLELRKLLLHVYLDVIKTFDNFCKFMDTRFILKPHIEGDISITMELNEYYDLQKQNTFIPSSDDLKRLNNNYLVAQSACLKHFILCFVKDLWINRYNNIEPLVLEGIHCTNKFNKYACELQLQYHKCINEMKNNSQIRKHDLPKLRDSNDKVYTFVNNFLTKADAHMLSLLLDLNMLNNWVNEFKENKENDCDGSAKFILTLQDRLHLMKNNLQSLTNLYNDNWTILKHMTNLSLNDTIDNDLDNADVEVNKCNTISTGIEVGKSDFDITGGDEVLISLSNNDNIEEFANAGDDNYEDQKLQKCLPGNVLDELKIILKDKKEEWLEREKKATLNSSMTIDTLDCDNLLNSNENYISQLFNKHSSSYSSRYNACDDTSFEEEDSTVRYKTIRDNSQNPESVQKNTQLELSDKSKEILQLDANDSDEETSYCGRNSNANSFANQIKLVQKSFNLNMNEDVLEDCFEDEVLSD